MTASLPTQPLPHDELPLLYRRAVQTILDEPAPEVDLSHLVPPHIARAAPASSGRRWSARVSGAALSAAAALLLVATLFVLRPVDAWAQVVEAVSKQPWVRMHATAPDKSAEAEVWLSPEKRIGAGRYPGAAFFLDLDQHTLRRFDQKDNTIYISDPLPTDLDNFVALDAVLESFATKQQPQQSGAREVKLVARSSKPGGTGDSRWTDYVLDYEDVRRSPPKFRRVFRVMDGSELPTTMTEEWLVDGKTSSRTFSMDYPATGPADLFALHVPRDAKVVDTRSGEDLKTLLAAYAKAQTHALEPYSATVLASFDDFRFLSGAYQVRCDGTNVSVAAIDEEQLAKFNDQVASGDVRKPEGMDPVLWWQDEVARLGFRALDSQSGVYSPHQVGYPLLGLPNANVRATLNLRPVVGPSECQMLTIDDSGIGGRRYWLDPARNSMVVRWEHQSPGRKESDWIDTTMVDAAEKSPQGRWYATQVRRGQVEHSGDDLRPAAGVSPVATQVYRYLIKFE